VPTTKCVIPISALLILASLPALSQSDQRTSAQSIRGYFASVNQRKLTMAPDFPEEMRTFGAVGMHIASGSVHAVKAGRGENVSRDQLDPKGLFEQNCDSCASGRSRLPTLRRR